MKVCSNFNLRIRTASQKSFAIALLAGLFFAAPALADVAPSPIPECVGKKDGTFCKRSDGTAGQCKTMTDARRPGRTWQTCDKDAHECDRLAIGAECSGYLGRPSHCREFSDPDKGTKWRTCQADEIDHPPAAAAAPATDSAAAKSPAPAAAPEPPPAKKGLFSCSAVPGGAAGSTLPLFGLSLLLFALSRRPRREA